MQTKLRSLLVAAFLVTLSGCATSGLGSAAKLGDAGARLTGQAAAPYSGASEQLQKNAMMHCASAALSINAPSCDATLSKQLAALWEMLTARAAFYNSLGAYYTSLGETAKLPPVSLTEATNASVLLAKSLAELMGSEFGASTEKAFKAAGASVEALAQMAEEHKRLKRLRKSSEHMRAALAVAVASYDVEREVTESISRAAAAHRKGLVGALATAKLLDISGISTRASDIIGAPVAPLSKDTQAAWSSDSGKAFVVYLADQESQKALREQAEANRLIVSGLQALISSHLKFEQERDVTAEDVDVFSKRLAIIFAKAA